MKYRYDMILVLGNGVEPDGTLSHQPRRGVEFAMRAFNDKQAPYVVMSGGLSYKAEGLHQLSEAQAMKDYAISLGMPSEAILTEAESKDTIGNAYFTKTNIMAPLHMTSVLVVPGIHHSQKRLAYIFTKVLGADYRYTIASIGELSFEERDREQRSLQKAQELLGNAADGDDAAVYAALRLSHPGYAVGNDKNDKIL